VAWEVIPALQRVLEPIYRRVLDFGDTIHKVEVEGETSKAPGVTRYWEASYHPVYNASDQIVAMCGIVDEITDLKTAEKERANSEARFQRLLEANLFGVATATLDGLIEANDAFLSIIEYSREDLLQHRIDWRKITPPEHQAKDMAGLENLKETGICPAFEKEYTRKDGQRVPVLIGATLLDNEPLRWIAFVVDLTERKSIEQHTRELMCEMAHRTKNLITVISAISHQLALTSSSLKDFQIRFSTRLRALAGIHDILIQEDWRGASVRELVLSQLAHCADLVDSRILLEGPPAFLMAAACQYIGIALHELCTNALKYGALSGEKGTVVIRWSMQAAERPKSMILEWIETGGPPAKDTTRRGFGHKVTTEIIARALNASVDQEFRKEGFRWSVAIPSTWLLNGFARASADEAKPALEAALPR
jgi:PAS domain S-box-containing protein